MKYVASVIVILMIVVGGLYYFDSPLLKNPFNDNSKSVTYTEEQFINDLIKIEKDRNKIVEKLKENGLTMDDALNILLYDVKIARNYDK